MFKRQVILMVLIIIGYTDSMTIENRIFAYNGPTLFQPWRPPTTTQRPSTTSTTQRSVTPSSTTTNPVTSSTTEQPSSTVPATTVTSSTSNPFDGPQSPNVLKHNDANFETSSELTFVLFYSPWCRYCKEVKPEFDKAASSLKTSHPNNVKLAMIDCINDGKQKCLEYNIQGYPTFKLFKNGQFVQDYQGWRDEQGFVRFVKANV